MKLTDAQIAALADHEAVPLGLPRRIEAGLVLAVEGRIERPGFAVTLRIEPQKVAHEWVSYRRIGALLEVGEQRWRLTPAQLATLLAYEQMQAAGHDIAARLTAWGPLVAALHGAPDAEVRAEGLFPRLILQRVKDFPPYAMSAQDGILQPAHALGHVRWAMASGHRYYLKNAA